MGDRYKDSRDKKTIPIIRVGTVVSAIDVKKKPVEYNVE